MVGGSVSLLCQRLRMTAEGYSMSFNRSLEHLQYLLDLIEQSDITLMPEERQRIAEICRDLRAEQTVEFVLTSAQNR